MNLLSLICALFAAGCFGFVVWRTKSIVALGLLFFVLSWMAQLLIQPPNIFP